MKQEQVLRWTLDDTDYLNIPAKAMDFRNEFSTTPTTVRISPKTFKDIQNNLVLERNVDLEHEGIEDGHIQLERNLDAIEAKFMMFFDGMRLNQDEYIREWMRIHEVKRGRAPTLATIHPDFYERLGRPSDIHGMQVILDEGLNRTSLWLRD